MQSRARTFAKLVTATAIVSTVCAAVPAGAFELFGMTFFGSDEPAETVIDPVNYTATISVAPAPDDDGLADTLTSASTLISDEDKPVSGSLGLLSKAKNDRKRLVAALFENARYDGLVDIFIEGRNVADLKPDANFSARPVPVSIRITPGPRYTLGRIESPRMACRSTRPNTA